MVETTGNNQSNAEDPLNGRTLEDLDPSELQQLADRVYEQLRRELLLERERMGLSRPFPNWPR
ncbi:MAG: hypothetical protein R2873_10145 [Caldilineaceae bacterium]|nr:hypothetical protein [Caldilineaceae bacterium]